LDTNITKTALAAYHSAIVRMMGLAVLPGYVEGTRAHIRKDIQKLCFLWLSLWQWRWHLRRPSKHQRWPR